MPGGFLMEATDLGDMMRVASVIEGFRKAVKEIGGKIEKGKNGEITIVVPGGSGGPYRDFRQASSFVYGYKLALNNRSSAPHQEGSHEQGH